MSSLRIHCTVVAAWLSVMAAALGIRTALGMPVAGVEALGWLLLGCVPPIALIAGSGGLDRRHPSPAVAVIAPTPATTLPRSRAHGI